MTYRPVCNPLLARRLEQLELSQRGVAVADRQPVRGDQIDRQSERIRDRQLMFETAAHVDTQVRLVAPDDGDGVGSR
jgi:hypothetical protein